MSDWTKLPEESSIEMTIQALGENGFNPLFAKDREEAKQLFFQTLPLGAEVFNATSITLDTLGIASEITQSGKYEAVRPKLMQMDRKTQAKEMRRLASAPDYVVGSVHAVTQDGHVMIASQTGSQLPAYVYGAGRVIWVVGAQKIVKDLKEGEQRIFTHSLPLEGDRANKAYNITSGSSVNKLLTIYKESNPQRITLLLVNEVLGF